LTLVDQLISFGKPALAALRLWASPLKYRWSSPPSPKAESRLSGFEEIEINGRR
jgi:hypothetical protein